MLSAKLFALASTYRNKRERLDKGSTTRKLWNALRPHRATIASLGYRITTTRHMKSFGGDEGIVLVYADTDIRVTLPYGDGRKYDSCSVYSREADFGLQAGTHQDHQDSGLQTDYASAKQLIDAAEDKIRVIVGVHPTATNVLHGLQAIKPLLDKVRRDLANLPEHSSEDF